MPFSADAAAPASDQPIAPPCLAMRVFRPPLPARVQTRDGHPDRLAARGIAGRVTHYAGPWRGSGDWWTPDAWARDEWDVALDGLGLFRIYMVGEQWYVGGCYD